MNIWKLLARTDYPVFVLKEERDREIVRSLRGASLTNSTILGDGEIFDNKVHPTHIAFIPISGPINTIVASQITINIISQLVTTDVEWLPTQAKGDEYYIVNVVNVLDCVDFDKSTVNRWQNGLISKISPLVFIRDCVADQHIFLIKDWEWGGIYVSDEFKALVEANDLTGAEFHPVAVH